MKQESNSRVRRIDFTHIAARLWIGKYVILASVCVAVLLGIVYILSSPKEYGTSMSMMPESERAGGSGAAQIALMMGVSVNSNSEDAYSPLVYSELVTSIPFLTSLFDVELQTSRSDTTFTLRDYVEQKIAIPWWEKLPLPSFDFGDDEETEGAAGAGAGAVVQKGADEMVDPFHLTKQEMYVVNVLRSRIWLEVDKLSGEIQLGATLQDPLASAQLTDTIAARLQEYVIDYRTAKARHDLDYAITINEEAKRQYYEAQQNYADYMDRNQGLALYSAQTTRDRLENEMKLAFNMYNQTSQQVQQSEAKVQEATPIFAVVNPATVLLYPTSPNKMRVLMVSVMLGFVVGVGILLYPSLFGRRFKRLLHHERGRAGRHRSNRRRSLLPAKVSRWLGVDVEPEKDDDEPPLVTSQSNDAESTPYYTIDDEPENTPDDNGKT